MADEVVVVRHGETEWSRDGRHTSRTDLPLTEAGRQVAEQLRGALERESFMLVLSSPLLRARQTCELAGYADRSEHDERLREWDYGEYEGLTTPQIREARPDWYLWRDGCPGGEGPAEICRRVDALLERLGPVEGTVLLFAHGHLLRVLTARWLELPPEAGARFKLEAAGVGRLGYERDNSTLLGWNVGPEQEGSG